MPFEIRRMARTELRYWYSTARVSKRLPRQAPARLRARHCLTSHGKPPLRHQIFLDKIVDPAVEHCVDVARLELRADVLDQLVRVQDVIANLRSERDVALRFGEFICLGPLLRQFQFVKARP